ncbi:DUF4260 domain-containing protein [Ulvibacter antarcticus]|uniref:Uncharacterized protein DUF4260 n=1 Tax=Ulvibacter antarcticus TaxID=442714 RepID=A0A3L9Z0L8_9FLAO|nr:DUF4260 domain-containing protein [Ulvibacter antarcticus]RMA66406.1 uncharacterized protein DUF4260 [Ulvibacter antarcticus]
MKTTLKLEELAQFFFGIFLFSQLAYEWWVFPALLLLPDVGMLGYLMNPKIGAMTYNLFHHKGIALAILMMGMLYWGDFYTLVGIILFSHAAMDRVFGYGLKYEDDFKNTHLGRIGKD